MKKQHLFLAAFAIAAIAGICSCSNDDELVAGQGKSIHVFTATMEGNPATRATFNSTGKYAEWEVNDEININGKSYKAKRAGAATSFVATDEDAEGETFTAYFPASLYNEGTPTLPASIEETWAEGKFNMPMYATSNNNELEFKNLCGVLAITVKSSVIASVKAIKISSGDKAVSGAFTVNDNAAVLTNATTATNTLTITYTDAVATTEAGVVFYAYLPAQSYNNLKIELSSDAKSFTKSMIVKKDQVTVERSKIYPVEYVAITSPEGSLGNAYAEQPGKNVNWVQLWEGGPKFATENITNYVGAPHYMDNSRYGWGYTGQYGESVIGHQYPEEDTEANNLIEENETATILWGDNWRMPTRAELQGLIDNCTVTKTTIGGAKGILFTGKDDYLNNSLFLSAEGYGPQNKYNNPYDFNWNGSMGYYWSSELEPNTKNPYYLGFDATLDNQFGGNIYIGCMERDSDNGTVTMCVRPVLKESKE